MPHCGSRSSFHLWQGTVMAFQDVLDRWQQGGRHAERLAGAAVLDLLTRADVQVFQNLDSDPEVTDDQREQLLDHLLRDQPTTPQAARDRLCEFCRQGDHQLSGASEPAAQSAVLGHVKSRTAWQRYVESSHGSSARGFATRRRRSAAMTVDDLLRLGVDQQQRLLAGRTLSRFNMWSFYQSAHPNSPFRNVTRTYDELKRRLGLGLMADANAEAVYWAHRLASGQTAHRTTALDAADYAFYRPGGRTQPLDGANDGLPEVVHVPVDGSQLVEPITAT